MTCKMIATEARTECADDRFGECGNRGGPQSGSGHAARHEAPNRGAQRPLDRPDHRPAGPVRLGDHGIIGNVDPFVVDPDTKMAVFRFPIRVGNRKTVSNRTTWTLAGFETIKPWLERR